MSLKSFKIPFLPGSKKPSDRQPSSLSEKLTPSQLKRPSQPKISHHSTEDVKRLAYSSQDIGDIYPNELTTDLSEWTDLLKVDIRHEQTLSRMERTAVPFLAFMIPSYILKLYYKKLEMKKDLKEHLLYVLNNASVPNSDWRFLPFDKISKRLLLPMDIQHKKNADVRIGFRWQNIFIVKNMFTTGVRYVEPGQSHIIQVGDSPLIYFEKSGHGSRPKNARSFDLEMYEKFERFVLFPRRIFRLVEKTTYCLMANQPSVFAVDICEKPLIDQLIRVKGISFRDPKRHTNLPSNMLQQQQKKKQKPTFRDIYDKPPPTPFLIPPKKPAAKRKSSSCSESDSKRWVGNFEKELVQKLMPAKGPDSLHQAMVQAEITWEEVPPMESNCVETLDEQQQQQQNDLEQQQPSPPNGFSLQSNDGEQSQQPPPNGFPIEQNNVEPQQQLPQNGFFLQPNDGEQQQPQTWFPVQQNCMEQPQQQTWFPLEQNGMEQQQQQQIWFPIQQNGMVYMFDQNQQQQHDTQIEHPYSEISIGDELEKIFFPVPTLPQPVPNTPEVPQQSPAPNNSEKEFIDFSTLEDPLDSITPMTGITLEDVDDYLKDVFEN